MPGILSLEELITEKFPSPNPRTIRYEVGFDAHKFEDLQAALDYCKAQGAGADPTTFWRVQLGQGAVPIPNGDLHLWEGIDLSGCGSGFTRLTGGMVTAYNRFSLRHLNIPAVGLSGVNVALRIVHDYGAVVSTLVDVVATCDLNTNGVVTAVEVTGTAGPGRIRCLECEFYGDNDDAGASAKAVGVRMMSGFRGAMELFGGTRVKTSAQNNAQQINLWRQTVSGGYFEAVGEYGPAYDGDADGKVWRTLNDPGTDRNIGHVFMPVKQSAAPNTRIVVDQDPHASADFAFHDTAVGELRVRRAFHAAATAEQPLYLRTYPLWVNAAKQLILNTTGVAPANENDGVLLTLAAAIYKMTSGNEYDCPFFSPTFIGDNPAFGRLRVVPFPIVAPITINQLRVYINTAQTGAAGRIVIYADSGNGTPHGGARLLDTGASSISGATTGAKTAAVSLTVYPGIIWVGAASDVGTSNPTYQAGTGRAPMIPQDSDSAANVAYYMDYTPNTTTLPPTFSVAGRSTMAARVRIRLA